MKSNTKGRVFAGTKKPTPAAGSVGVPESRYLPPFAKISLDAVDLVSCRHKMSRPFLMTNSARAWCFPESYERFYIPGGYCQQVV